MTDAEQADLSGEESKTEVEVITPKEASERPGSVETVEQPAKVMRIGSMTRQLLEEVRHAPLDEASRGRMKEIYETSLANLAEGLSPELQDELRDLALPFSGAFPSDAELRVAHGALVGWLEGLFHGIQATLFAQQMATKAQLEELQRRGLPPGVRPGEPTNEPTRPGTYL